MSSQIPGKRRITTGQVCRILERSYATVYRLIEAGVLQPTNGLHPTLRGKRQHRFLFDPDEVRRVSDEMNEAVSVEDIPTPPKP